MSGVREEMPFQWLAISLQVRPQALLHRNRCYMILAAKKYEGWTLKLPHRVVRMPRSQFARAFVADRRVITNKTAYAGRRGYEMDPDAVTDAVSHDGARVNVAVLP